MSLVCALFSLISFSPRSLHSFLLFLFSFFFSHFLLVTAEHPATAMVIHSRRRRGHRYRRQIVARRRGPWAQWMLTSTSRRQFNHFTLKCQSVISQLKVVCSQFLDGLFQLVDFSSLGLQILDILLLPLTDRFCAARFVLDTGRLPRFTAAFSTSWSCAARTACWMASLCCCLSTFCPPRTWWWSGCWGPSRGPVPWCWALATAAAVTASTVVKSASWCRANVGSICSSPGSAVVSSLGQPSKLAFMVVMVAKVAVPYVNDDKINTTSGMLFTRFIRADKGVRVEFFWIFGAHTTQPYTTSTRSVSGRNVVDGTRWWNHHESFSVNSSAQLAFSNFC